MSARQILEAVARRHGCDIKQITGPGRCRSLVRARHEAMLWIRSLTPLSYPEIGRLFGRRDHCTVMNGCDQAFARMPARGAA